MKVLVTGGAGFIGSHLVDKLAEQGKEVIVIDNLSTGKKENINPKAKFYQADICDSEISQIFQKERPKIVFHLAAMPRVPISVKDPVGTSKINILGTINVFKSALDAGVNRVIFASSSSVYGDQRESPLVESMKPSPISPYGLQKQAGEQFAELFTNLYKLPIICLRYFNVYGTRIDFGSDYSLVIGKFLKQKALNKPLTIFGDGEQTRGFCYVDDVARANILAAESDKLKGGEKINISSGESYSINYLAKEVGGEIQYLSPREGDILHTKADITRAKNLLNWEPKVSFEEGLKKVKEWFNRISN